MADGENTRFVSEKVEFPKATKRPWERRKILHKGMICLYGERLWHPSLRGSVGKTIKAGLSNNGAYWALFKGEAIRLRSIPSNHGA